MILKSLIDALGDAEKITFSISRGKEAGQHQVLIVTTLAKEPDKLSEQGKRLRLQLARPVVFGGAIDSLDREFAAFLEGLAPIRAEVATGYAEVLAELGKGAQAAKKTPAKKAPTAKAAAPKKPVKKGKQKLDRQSSPPAPETPEPEEAPPIEEALESPATEPSEAPPDEAPPEHVAVASGANLFADIDD